MRQQILTVFDEFVPPGNTWTSTQFNSTLGSADQISLHTVIDNVTGAGTGGVNIFVEHSGDGRNWIQRNDQRATGASTTGDLSFVTAVAGAYSLMWADNCNVGNAVMATNTTGASIGTGFPLLPFVRLRISTATLSHHIKITVALRGPR